MQATIIETETHVRALTANHISTGDCLTILPTVATDSIDLIVTSPPYFQQREYGGAGIGNETFEAEYLDN